MEIEHYISIGAFSLFFKCVDNPLPISWTELLSKIFDLTFIPRVFENLKRAKPLIKQACEQDNIVLTTAYEALLLTSLKYLLSV